MMFARLDFSTFLICCSGDFSDNKSDEKPSVTICGGSICILSGLYAQIHYQPEVVYKKGNASGQQSVERCLVA